MRSGWLSSRKNFDVSSEIAGIRDDLGDIMSRVSRVTSAAGGELQNGVSSLADARQRLSGAAHDAYGQGRDWFGAAEDEFRQGVKHARSTVRENPLAGIAIAAGIGFVLGLSTRLR